MRCDVWSIRSPDEVRTWTDRQPIFLGFCGAVTDIIETRAGNLVTPVQHLWRDPARHVQFTCVSTDGGRSWRQSSIIDLGGHGHHDVCEGTVAELSDGRLLMLLRTSLDRFWEAWSDDGGLSWREIRPSPIDASSAPGYLLGLESGRLALAWNRLYPATHNRPRPPRTPLAVSVQERDFVP